MFIAVLRLNLDKVEEVAVADVFCRRILDYEKKYKESVSEAKLFTLQQCIHNARKQVKAAFDRRFEVLNSIRRTLQQAGDPRPFPRETFWECTGINAGRSDPPRGPRPVVQIDTE